jgi:hypothetical protein
MVATLAVILLLSAPVIGVTAYLAGRRAASRMTVPWRPIFQLVDHRTRCLGHDRTRVQRELGALLPVPPWAWEELLAMRRPLGGRRLRTGAARSAP